MAHSDHFNAVAPKMSLQGKSGQDQATTTGLRWTMLCQAIYWGYLFAVTTALAPFPVDVAAYAIRDSEGSSLTQVFFLGLFGVSVVLALMNARTCKKNLSRAAPILIPLALSFLVFLIATLLSDQMEIGIRKLALYIISTSTLVLIASTAPTARALSRSTARFLAVILITSIVGVLLIPERAIHQAYLYQGAWRGIVSHKNFMGAILVLSIFFFLLEWTTTQQRRWGILIILAIGFLWMTESKTAVAGLVFAALLARLLTTRFLSITIPVFYWASAVGFCGSVCLFFLYGETLFTTFGLSSDLTGRFPLWDLVLRVSDKPIVGHGFESFFNLGTASPLFSEGGVWSRFASHAHNGYLNIYIYGGLAGLILVFSFLIGCYALGLNARRHTRLAWLPLAVVVFETIRNITEVDVFTSVRVTFSLTIVAGMVLAQMAHSEKPV